MNVLVLDQGSSATKALVLGDDGRLLSFAEEAFPTITTTGGVELDPHAVLASIVNAGRRALADAGEPVQAVGIANQGESVVAWDRHTGEATSPIISWQDRRATRVTDDLANHADTVRALTGLPLDPYFTAPKLRWLRDQTPTTSIVTGIDAWMHRVLLGTSMTDVTTASRSLLLNLEERTWSNDMVDLFGLDAADLPTLVPSAGDLGTTSAFGPTLPVRSLVVDQQAALLGEGCLRAGEAKCTYGTGAFLLVATGPTAVHSTHGLSSSVAWDTGGDHAYCLDGQVYTAGSAVTWLERTGLLSRSEDIDALLTDYRPSSTMCVPAFAGLGAPQWRPTAQGQFVGLSLATTRSDLVYAVLEGVAAQIALVVRAAEADTGHAITRLKVDGGLTQSHAFLQLQADLLQIPLDVFASPHATAYGVDTLVRAATFPEAGLGEPSLRSERRVEPQMPAEQAAERLQRWSERANDQNGDL